MRVGLYLLALCLIGGCQPKDDPLPPTVPPPEDLSTWSGPELVQPPAPEAPLPQAVQEKATPAEQVLDFAPGATFRPSRPDRVRTRRSPDAR